MNNMSPEEATFLNWLTTERSLALECHAIGSCFSPEEFDSSMQRCLAIVTEQVEGAEALLQMGILRYLQDVASCLLSNTTTFVHEVSRAILELSLFGRRERLLTTSSSSRNSRKPSRRVH